MRKERQIFVKWYQLDWVVATATVECWIFLEVTVIYVPYIEGLFIADALIDIGVNIKKKK